MSLAMIITWVPETLPAWSFSAGLISVEHIKKYEFYLMTFLLFSWYQFSLRDFWLWCQIVQESSLEGMGGKNRPSQFL